MLMARVMDGEKNGNSSAGALCSKTPQNGKPVEACRSELGPNKWGTMVSENVSVFFKMTETKEYDTEFNWEKVGFTVETGKLLLWPSHLYHLTERNRSKERFTISFNTLDKSYLDALNRLTQ